MNTDTKEGVIIQATDSFSRPERELPVARQTDNTPMAMLATAIQRGMDASTIKDLLDLQERFDANEARKAFNVAFANFKAEAVKVIRNKTRESGPLINTKYAELFSVVNAVSPELSKYGLSTAWKITKDEKEWIEVTCTMSHAMGHSESVSMGGPPDTGGAKSPIQARASSVSLLERYTLKAICGVAEQGEDDDGAPVSKGMPQEEYDHWVKMITEKTTKGDAKESWKTANKACAACNDVESAKKLKDVLIKHGKFIDNAAVVK